MADFEEKNQEELKKDQSRTEFVRERVLNRSENRRRWIYRIAALPAGQALRRRGPGGLPGLCFPAALRRGLVRQGSAAGDSDLPSKGRGDGGIHGGDQGAGI